MHHATELTLHFARAFFKVFLLLDPCFRRFLAGLVAVARNSGVAKIWMWGGT